MSLDNSNSIIKIHHFSAMTIDTMHSHQTIDIWIIKNNIKREDVGNQSAN